MSTDIEQKPDRTFELHVKDLAFSVRRLLAELATATGIDISQPRSAARMLGIDKMLVWKMAKIATSSDPVAAMSTFPGTSAQRSLLQAFAKAGAPPSLLERARAAFDEFQQMVEQHADDRETFEMMLSSLPHGGQPTGEESHRKLAFQGNSAIWGLHCRVRTCTYIITPSEDPEFGNLGIVGSFVDVRRLRRDVNWTLATIAALNSDGRPVADNPIQPLFSGQTEFDGTPTLPEFCRGELPPIRRVLRPNGITHYQLTEGAVGNSGAFTWSIGWRYPRVLPRWRTDFHRVNDFALHMLLPVETAQLDVMVHKDFWPELRPNAAVFHLNPGDPPGSQDWTEQQKVRAHICVERLHEDPLDLVVHDVPGYARMLEAAFEAMGHRSVDFAGFRVRMKYPILSTEICMRIDTPERPPSHGA